MLKIYLCEDSKPQLDTLENTIQKYLFINHSNGKIVCKTQNPMELLSYLHAAPIPIWAFITWMWNSTASSTGSLLPRKSEKSTQGATLSLSKSTTLFPWNPTAIILRRWILSGKKICT